MRVLILAVLYLSQTSAYVSPSSKFSLGYAENPFKSHNLSLVEEKFITEIAKTPGKLICSEAIFQYFNNFHSSSFPAKHLSAEERATRVVDNALLWYKMLSRIVNLLKSLKIDNECNRNVRQTINKLFSDANLPLPEEHDLRQAILGILRIHYVYGYNATSEMRLGIFGDRNTGVSLDFTECLQIAHRAILLQLSALAYQWLDAAAQVTEGNGNKMMELNRAWLTLAYQLGLNSTDILHRIAVGRKQLSHFAYHSHSLYATCRGESTQNYEDPKLRCYYQRTNGYLTLNPVKVEVLSIEPLILVFHKLFGDEQVEFLHNSAVPDETVDIFVSRNLTVPKDQEGEYVEEFGRFETTVHFTSDVNLYHNEENPMVVRIEQKMDLAAGFISTVITTNIKVYGSLGAHYDIHHDTFQQTPIYTLEHGDRMANFLIFLADTELGGNLGFPVAGVYAKSIKGNAVFWFNTLDDGNIDFRNLHMGCPVILGTKEIMCTSYFEHDNVWKYPCPKERTPVKYSDACMQLTTKLGFDV